MTFADRTTRLPLAFDAARGREAVQTLGLSGGTHADLVAGTAGSSPFLESCLLKEPAWSAELLSVGPEVAFSELLSVIRDLDDRALEQGLRQAKRRLALLTALADLSGVWTLDEVTGALTLFADTATDVALKSALANEIRRGKLPGLSDADLATGAGMICLAMGKMGAGELNYSSDIDLILLYEDALFDGTDQMAARQAYVRAARRMTKLLSDRTGDGYVFRTDLRLRPDASVTPVVVSTEMAERYYESVGRTWERAAYIKARPAAVDIEAGERFLAALRPFVWRRHLDFAAIQDAHDIRLRIKDSKGLYAKPSHLGHDLKLGAGGIREIEFFTQTRQLIAGGRDESLRTRRTREGLRDLAHAGWIGADDANALDDDYVALREAEHRVQMIADQQTHKLPTTEDEFRRFACLSGRDANALKADLLQRFERVSRLTNAFFAPSTPGPAKVEMSQTMTDIVGRWHSYPALRSTRAGEIFARVQPMLLSRLSKTARPETVLVHLDTFLAGLPAGVQLFSLFEANPSLLDLVVDIAETAPGLARYLSRNPQVFDAVIGGGFFSDWPGVDALAQGLSHEVEAEPDYEAALDAARRWVKEWHFRIGVHALRTLIDADTAACQYAELAEATLKAILPLVEAEFARRHGPPPGRGAAVLAMGSLGAGRLGPASDLDLIIIYDADGVEASDGPRPLQSRAYYARLTQALVTALSAPMAEGRLYEVDMRLRPSGRQGPVATSLQSFEAYQRDEAWTWEHLALTRARPIAGPVDLTRALDQVRCDLLMRPRDPEKTIADVQDMRTRLAEAKGAEGPFDAKNGPGRMMDLELLAATACLLAGATSQLLHDQIRETDAVFGVESAALAKAIVVYRQVIIGAALIRENSGPVVDETEAAALARFSGDGSAEVLRERLDTVAGQITTLVDAALGAQKDQSD